MRILLSALLLLAPMVLAQDPVPAPPTIGASGHLMIDFHSGAVITENNADQRMEPASITKLMTSYIVFRELRDGNLSLDEQVTISEHAWRTGGSRMFVEIGNQVSVEDLIRGVIIQSGNDASVALAEHIAGSEDAFAGLMNQVAAELGMTGTNYTNATGWPHEELYTTARDIARLGTAMIRDFPDYYAWYSEKEFTYNGIRQHNRNRLLWRDPSVDGMKTGHTEAAGYCLTTSAVRDGMRLITVIMGSASEESRANESQALLNYGFRFFETYQLYQQGDPLTTARIWKGKANNVELGVDRALHVTIPRGRYDDLEASVELDPRITAPIAAGTPLGEVVVILNENTVARHPLVALDEVEAAGFFGRGWDSFRLWISSWFSD